MRFAFTEEQTMLRDSVRALLARDCDPKALRAAWASADGRVPGLWEKLAALGVVGATTPEAYGGLGLGAIEMVAIAEEAGRAALPEPLVETMAVAAPLLAHAADHDVRARWLPSIAAGKTVVAVRLGGAPYVSHAKVADLLLLQRDDELHAVTRDAVTLEPQRSVDGARRIARVAWTPQKATCVCRGEASWRAIGEAVDRGALATSAELLGLSRRMIDVAVDYVKVREQFGKPIGSFQAVKHHLADALGALEAARPVVYRAAWSIATASPERSLHVSMAKAFASDAATLVAKKALWCHGAIGYSYEHDLHLFMKRAWALAAAWGDAAYHRARVGAVLFQDTRAKANEARS